jgi:hypothetical protein
MVTSTPDPIKCTTAFSTFFTKDYTAVLNLKDRIFVAESLVVIAAFKFIDYF